jgi:hypothetical protein
MKQTRFILFSVLALVLAACSGSAGTEASGPTVETGGGLDLSAGAPVLDLSDPTSFKELPGNYTVAMDFRFEATQADGTPIASSWRLDGVGQAEPEASRYTFSGEGAANINGSAIFEVTYIGDQSYFYTSEMGCINMTVDTTASPFDTMVDTGGMLTNEVQRVMPDETINGVPAYHYAITQQNLDLADPESMDVREITDGAIYVAKDGGYVLRLVMEGRGASSLLSGDESLEGDIFYQLDFTPVPSVGEITPPEGCSVATEAEFPIMPDATATASFQGFLSYQSPSTLEVIIDFYKTEMAAAGWSLDEENTMANIATLRFARGDEIVSVVVTFDANTSISSVIVGEEQ